eukprot:537313-Pleurochrysis_carterae.AAC.3
MTSRRRVELAPPAAKLQKVGLLPNGAEKLCRVRVLAHLRTQVVLEFEDDAVRADKRLSRVGPRALCELQRLGGALDHPQLVDHLSVQVEPACDHSIDVLHLAARPQDALGRRVDRVLLLAVHEVLRRQVDVL